MLVWGRPKVEGTVPLGVECWRKITSYTKGIFIGTEEHVSALHMLKLLKLTFHSLCLSY